jgi:hypothetical protein
MKKWLKMGLELEGSWTKPYNTVAADVKGAQGKEDGSVKSLPNEPLGGYRGEITTRPHATLDRLCEDVLKLYPDAVNSSCGMHIHASFAPMDYSLLTEKAFWKHYRERWEKWGNENEAAMGATKDVFWNRWNGQPDLARNGRRGAFCKAEFKPMKQYVEHEDDRYTQLNFLAYHRYQTLESRLLPMFHDKAVAVLAIREMADIYDSYLSEARFPRVDMVNNYKTEAGVLLEEKKLKTPNMTLRLDNFKGKAFKAPPVGEDITYVIKGATEYMMPIAEVAGEEP